jgi:hypothetical protein
MGGYAAREGGADGTLDELTVSCLALEAAGERFALVAIDLVGVDEAMVKEIAGETGLPSTSIALSASHTHSGPAGVLKRLHPVELDQNDPSLRNGVVEAACRVVRQALDSSIEATVTFRQSQANGVSANRSAENGPFDPTVSVISAIDRDGMPIATVVHFACHPTILPAASRKISADFPGAIRCNLPANDFGVVLFVNGAAGDVSTRFTRRSQDFTEVMRVGAVVAEAVKSAGNPQALTPRIEAVCSQRSIRLRRREEIDATLGRASRTATRNDLSPAERRIAETRLQGADILRQIAQRIDSIPSQINLCAWTLGELTLIGFPGELFASLGAEVTDSEKPSLVLGYTNGYRGYFANQAAYDAGTYEALSSPYAPGASEELVAWIRSQR